MKLKIKELREEYGMTQRELAEKVDNVQRNLCNWEKGTAEPDCETIVKLADALDTSIDDLFGRRERGIERSDDESAVIALVHKLDKEQTAALKSFLLAMNK